MLTHREILEASSNLVIELLALFFTAKQAFIQCAIPVRAHSTKEIAVVHSGHSAVAINNFISSLDLKGQYMFSSQNAWKSLLTSLLL